MDARFHDGDDVVVDVCQLTLRQELLDLQKGNRRRVEAEIIEAKPNWVSPKVLAVPRIHSGQSQSEVTVNAGQDMNWPQAFFVRIPLYVISIRYF
jgi:hypothetical protein